jgi:hypothetical protein
MDNFNMENLMEKDIKLTNKWTLLEILYSAKKSKENLNILNIFIKDNSKTIYFKAKEKYNIFNITSHIKANLKMESSMETD